MTSSPTSSSPTSSTTSSVFSTVRSSKFSSLPVMALREKIVEKILENRVTLIVGETGCGKSSQVPQFLLEANMEPILCTQPRRFAVVAVARMVAKARNCEVGDEVGYHIGHSKVLSERTKIVFKTAGVLLDEMREKGLKALNYKVIILDEVHERSVESDLVLVCVKQFLLKNKDLRVVLMSATADITRYRDYFRDLGRDERVQVLGIPNSDQQTIFQRRVSYLDQVVELLGMDSGSIDSLSMTYCYGTSPSVSRADVKPEVQKLIHDLVMHIHETELDIEKGILIFLPTYASLEQQWHLLERHTGVFKVHILHRSIDTEQALMAMKISKTHRKVILATNIAESSVTIPKVAFVIDSCRSLQVFWDSNRKTETSDLVWVSKSQADQRRGRTGRTCDGQVYRLVTGPFYSKLQDYESPSILRLSLRQQVLLICCAEFKAINDPKVLLQKAMDPPDPEVVENALSLLIHMGALKKISPRGRYEATFYGRLIASFSLSFDASVLILKFGDVGMLREGIVLGIIMDTQPLPILHPFGQQALFSQYTDSYFSPDGDNNTLLGRKDSICMANLHAFQFWQRIFQDKHRIERLKFLITSNEMKATNTLLPKIEEEWCSFHNLVQSSLRHVSEIYDEIIDSLHRFRPKYLVSSSGLPSYHDPYEFEHTCLLKCQPDEDTILLPKDGEPLEPTMETRNCVAVPFVGSNHFQSKGVAEKLATVIKEIRVLYTTSISENQPYSGDDKDFEFDQEVPICKYFMSGSCNRGSQCLFSHSLQAKRPECKFFFSFQGCRNGELCFFSHSPGPSFSSFSESNSCLPEDEGSDATLLIELFPTSSDGCILLLDDTDLHFSSNILRHFDPKRIISTTSQSVTTPFDTSLSDVRVLWGLDHPYDTIISNHKETQVPWDEVKCLLWFPRFDSDRQNVEIQKSLVRSFFQYLSIRILADSLNEVQVILTMNNLKFSQLQVEKLGRECFFFLTQSFTFDESTFGELSNTVGTTKPMLTSKAISYVFNLLPPTDIQFGDYASELREVLHAM